MCHAEPFDKLRINSAKHLYHGERDPSVAEPALSLSKGALPHLCLPCPVQDGAARCRQGDTELDFGKAIITCGFLRHRRHGRSRSFEECLNDLFPRRLFSCRNESRQKKQVIRKRVSFTETLFHSNLRSFMADRTS